MQLQRSAPSDIDVRSISFKMERVNFKFCQHLILLLLFFNPIAQAAETKSLLKDMEFSYEVGRDQLSGALSSESFSASHGLHALLWGPGVSSDDGWLGAISGHFDLGLVRAGSPQVRASAFPFTAQADVVMTRSTLSPTVCGWSTRWVQGCVGVGYGLLHMEQGQDNNQTYGLFLYTLSARHQFQKGVTIALKTDWSRLAMRVQNQDAAFEMWNTSFMLGYRF